MTPNPTPTRAGDDRIAFIQACWHREIVDQARDAFLATIEEYGFSRDRVELFEVPGTLEIPLQAKRLARTGRFAAIVATAFVVDGGIYRHDFVSGTVVEALMRVQLDTDVPVLSAVLTPQAFHDHEEHRSFFREHFKIKGAEVARACVQTIDNLAAIQHPARELEATGAPLV